MDLTAARDFLRAHHRSVLATTRGDGRPQMSPVVHAVDDAGRLLISSREPAFKVRNIRRDPRVSVLAISDGFFGEWVQADGAAEIVSLPDAMELLVEYYRRVSGEHPDWDEYRRAMAADRRCVIRVAIERAGPDRSG
jgi:PPOX class probable F420-dependent enzyme